MRRSFGMSVAALFILACPVAPVSGRAGFKQQPSVEQAIDSLIATRTFREVAVSPDGSKVAWSIALLGADKAPSGKYAIYVADLKSPASAPTRVTKPEHSNPRDAAVKPAPKRSSSSTPRPTRMSRKLRPTPAISISTSPRPGDVRAAFVQVEESRRPGVTNCSTLRSAGPRAVAASRPRRTRFTNVPD